MTEISGDTPSYRSVPPTFPRHQTAPETHLHACSRRAGVKATFPNNSESLVPTPGAKWFLSSPLLQWPHCWLVTVLGQTARLSRPVVNLSACLPWIKCVCQFIVSSSAGMTPSTDSGGNMSSLFFIQVCKVWAAACAVPVLQCPLKPISF